MKSEKRAEDQALENNMKVKDREGPSKRQKAK